MKRHSCIIWLGVVLFATNARPVQGDENIGLEGQVGRVAALKQQAYVEAREGLEARYRQDPKSFEQLVETSEDWRVRLLCRIVAERVNKAEAIGEFLKQEPKVPITNEWEGRYEMSGKALAEQGKEVPMFLAERFWRASEFQMMDGELVDWEFQLYTRYQNECALARALGYLKLSETRELLESALDPRFYAEDFEKQSLEKQKSILREYSHPRGQAARAIGEVGSPLSIPSLIGALEMEDRFGDTSASDRLGIALARSIDNADKSMMPLLKQKAAETKVASRKEYLEKKIRALEQSEK